MTTPRAKAEDVALLPCVFCKHEPLVEPWHGGGPQKHMAHCYNDECAIDCSVTGETKRLAIRKWNNAMKLGLSRPAAPPVPREPTHEVWCASIPHNAGLSFKEVGACNCGAAPLPAPQKDIRRDTLIEIAEWCEGRRNMLLETSSGTERERAGLIGVAFHCRELSDTLPVRGDAALSSPPVEPAAGVEREAFEAGYAAAAPRFDPNAPGAKHYYVTALVAFDEWITRKAPPHG